jgi:hypothetical protein
LHLQPEHDSFFVVVVVASFIEIVVIATSALCGRLKVRAAGDLLARFGEIISNNKNVISFRYCTISYVVAWEAYLNT